MRSAIVFLLVVSCGGGEDGIPPGTMCFTVDGVETCLMSGDLDVAQSLTSGKAWFHAMGRLPGGRIEIMGQVPENQPLPYQADHVVLSLPVTGVCARMMPAGLFAPCQQAVDEVTCVAAVHYDEARSLVEVRRLAEGELEATFEGALRAELPDDCCAADPVCDDRSARFEPSGEIAVTGRVHVKR